MAAAAAVVIYVFRGKLNSIIMGKKQSEILNFEGLFAQKEMSSTILLK